MEPEKTVKVPPSLKKFLTRKLAVAAKNHAALLKVLDEQNVSYMHQFRQGCERVAYDEIKKIKHAALKRWGSLYVEQAMQNEGIHMYALQFAARDLLKTKKGE